MSKKDILKPPSLSDEEWDEEVTKIEDQYIDNNSHQTVQIKLKSVLKVVIPIGILVAIGLLYFMSQMLQIAFTTVIAGIVGLLILYYIGVEEHAGQN